MKNLNSRVAMFISGDVIGGAERSALLVLAASCDQADLVLLATSDVVLDESTLVAPLVHRVRVSDRAGFASSFLAHRRLLGGLGLNLLQVTLPNPFAARAMIMAAHSLRLPTVTVEQLVLPSRRRRGRLLKRVLSAPLAAQVVVGHRSAQDLHRFYGIPRRAIRIIHNGVPDEPIKPITFDRATLVGCAARLEDQKQIEVLLAAVADIPEVHLVLVGDGTRRVDLEKLAAQLGISGRTTFIGWVPDARPWIASFDVFVLPSRDEAFPLAIVEAMFAGVPVIATDVGSVSEAIVDGVTGLLVPSGDQRALVEAIRRMLDSPPFAFDLARRAETLARQRFSAETMGAAYHSLWDEVLSCPPWWTRPVRRVVVGRHVN